MHTHRLLRAFAGTTVIGLLGIAGVGAFATAAHAAGTTITVTTTTDDNATNGNCSLREALAAANTDTAVDACPAGSGADTILLGSHTYTVSIDELDVLSNVTIQGVASDSTIIDYEPSGCTNVCTRAFFVHGGGALTMSHVAIAHAPTAIRNQGTLNLAGIVIDSENASCGSHPIDVASGIENHGTATLQGVSITRTGDTIFNALGATFTAAILTMHDNGPCDEGQSIENSGTMSLANSTFEADIDHLDYATSIQNEPTGHLSVMHSRFRHNTGGQGTEVISNVGNATITDSAFDDNTIVPIVNDGVLDVFGSRFSTNNVGFYEPGAIENLSDAATIVSSTIDHNIGPNGGAVSNNTGASLTLTNDTITDNAARDSAIGAKGSLPSGGLTNYGIAMIRNTTIARNQVLGFHDWHYHAGGLVTMPHGYTALSNSILSDNSAQAPVTAPDCYGVIHSLGYNLVENTADCFVGATTTGNILGPSAHLYPLAANGGPTMTSLPRWDSPEVDSANPATPDNDNQAKCAERDQRGIARPRDGNADGVSRCDMGAVER
ncbi:MAG TPA: choice-of-anchor Q domain-containing protein [Acidimicrobiia bacterium]|jgi:CSLREA domain-containing protein